MKPEADRYKHLFVGCVGANQRQPVELAFHVQTHINLQRTPPAMAANNMIVQPKLQQTRASNVRLTCDADVKGASKQRSASVWSFRLVQRWFGCRELVTVKAKGSKRKAACDFAKGRAVQRRKQEHSPPFLMRCLQSTPDSPHVVRCSQCLRHHRRRRRCPPCLV